MEVGSALKSFRVKKKEREEGRERETEGANTCFYHIKIIQKGDSPNAIAAIHARTLHIRRFVALHGHLPHCARATIVQHLVSVSSHCRRANLHLINRVAVGEATACCVAMLQPHGIRAVLGLDLGIGLCVRERTIVTSASSTCWDSVE